MKTLILVESPTKSKTISQYLGKNFLVQASLGHVMDLPKTEPSFDKETFEPIWVILPKKKKLVSKLQKISQEVEQIFLATDPDREGEAISAHLEELIKKTQKKIYRIRFTEITKQAILKAVQSPTEIDKNLVEAQKARRVLDRILGYGMSSSLWSLKPRLSAGRVQSIPLKWICEREEEIQNFVPKEYYEVKGKFEYNGFVFEAKLKNEINLDFIQSLFGNANFVNNKLKKIIEKPEVFSISKLERKTQNKFAPPPFTTSSLQKTLNIKLGLSPTQSMKLLSELYEGVKLRTEYKGLITYPRTDSTRVSSKGVAMAHNVIQNLGFEPIYRNFPKSKNKIQDAHEAIRPTDPSLHPKDLIGKIDKKLQAIYNLIWVRFLSFFFPPAEVEVHTIQLKKQGLVFETSWEFLRNPSYLFLEGKQKEESNLPNWNEKEEVLLKELEAEKKFTEPPPRYTEASLIEKLEKSGIGRPSTYAPTVATLFLRKYAMKKKKIIHPTQLGIEVNAILQQNFSKFLEDEYTKQMEESLDKIEEGFLSRKKFLEICYKDFHTWKKNISKSSEKTLCPLCKEGELKTKVSKKGKPYWICSRYPQCEYMKYKDND
ncbi:MAG: type I DNA topoisomerase [Candidatus Pacearchaeota archaeon]